MSDLAAALNIAGARWALPLVERLLDGPQRYSDLQRGIGVPTNMLAFRLRELEAADVLSRLPLRNSTRASALTERGLSSREELVALGRWESEATCVWGGVTMRSECSLRGPTLDLKTRHRRNHLAPSHQDASHHVLTIAVGVRIRIPSRTHPSGLDGRDIDAANVEKEKFTSVARNISLRNREG